jgi:adenosyl cobinamide kinase/adenosyl cobinamide phosphate guanylyltransferase
MFSVDGSVDQDAPARVANCLLQLADEQQHTVFVCDTIFSDAIAFEDATNDFRAGLAYVATRLAEVCEGVIEVTAGIPTVRKLPGEETQTKPKRGEAGMHLITGGAFQGKTAYAAARYALNEEDVFTCAADSIAVDFSRRCITKLENFSLACVRQGVDPAELMISQKSAWSNAILVCGDISAGVVPTEPVYRAWREANGRLLQALASHAFEVTRMFAGLPERLK